jgi:hypothetical protein
VTVDGESVVRVSLWLCSDRRPLWENSLDQRVLVEALKHWNRTVSLKEECNKFVNCSRRPTVGPIWHLFSKALKAPTSNAISRPR